MGESTKTVCALLMTVGSIISLIAWMDDRPSAITWGFRIGSSVTAILSLVLILMLHFRADIEPDYLRTLTGTYFNRDGFCFSFVVTNIEGIAILSAYYQTQHDKPCVGRIALRPARGFFHTRTNIETITFEVACPASGLGIASVAIPLPAEVQGKRQSFEVGASVHYPEGKGRRIRYHDGVFLRSNSNFGNSFGTALTIVGAVSGAVVLSSPATATVVLPTGVAEEIPQGLKPATKILWQKGDQPLKKIV